jgi:hypothetical protein
LFATCPFADFGDLYFSLFILSLFIYLSFLLNRDFLSVHDI